MSVVNSTKSQSILRARKERQQRGLTHMAIGIHRGNSKNLFILKFTSLGKLSHKLGPAEQMTGLVMEITKKTSHRKTP